MKFYSEEQRLSTLIKGVGRRPYRVVFYASLVAGLRQPDRDQLVDVCIRGFGGDHSGVGYGSFSRDPCGGGQPGDGAPPHNSLGLVIMTEIAQYAPTSHSVSF